MQHGKPIRYVNDVVRMTFDVIAAVEFGLDESGEPITCRVVRELHLVRPYSEELRLRAFRQRGRDGFSGDKAVCLLPSARFYAKARLQEEEEERTIDGEIVDED